MLSSLTLGAKKVRNGTARSSDDRDRARALRIDQDHRPARITLLREIKVDSPVHGLWAGTKLICVGGLSLTLSLYPSWGAIGVMVVLLLTATLLARVPAGAWPRPPVWFWLVLVVTGALASAAGGSPHLTVATVTVGLGSLDAFSRFVAVGVVLLLGAAIIGWTTPLGEIAPAVSRLLSPLRLIRVPVDEAAVVIALCVRSLPLLVGEMRTLVAARRLRPTPARDPERWVLEHWLDDLVDFLVAALGASVRRSSELAEAITARGGTGLIVARARKPGWSDAAVLAVVALVCFAATTFPGS